MYTFPVFYGDNYTPDRGQISLISKTILCGKASLNGLSIKQVTKLAEMFHKVLPHQILSQCLTPLVFRPYPDRRTRVSIRTRGRDF